MPEDYVYAVTRVHINEQNLLSQADLEQLISAPSANDAFRLLADKGWGGPEVPQNSADALVAAETDKTWGLIEELCGGVEQFDVLRLANDFHNLKAAIKLAYSASLGEEDGRYYLRGGTVELDKIKAAAASHDFGALPPDMAAAGKAAYEALAHTGNGQECDMAVDRACLLAIAKAGKAAKSQLLEKYAMLVVDSANIKAAVRCCLMGKSREFIERAVAPAGSLDTRALMDAAVSGSPDAIYALLEHTAYSGAVEALKTSMPAFERWCDNQMMALIRPQRTNYFSIEPLAAYILGRENEIRMVRLILSAKLNHLGDDALRERLRDTYV